jgi:hypothetical protein
MVGYTFLSYFGYKCLANITKYHLKANFLNNFAFPKKPDPFINYDEYS